MRIGHLVRRVFVPFAFAGAACSGPSQPNHTDPMHAIAIAYVRKPLAAGFSIEGTFALPRVAHNRGWYAEWFTYTGKLSQMLPNPPYVQVGLIRSPEERSLLQAFVAARPRGGNAGLRTLGVLSDRPHHLAFTSQDGVLAFAVDGKTLYREADADFFTRDATDTYLQLGHELSQTRDVAQGTISGVRFASAGTEPAAIFARGPACFFYSNGVTLSASRDTLAARGTFDPSVTDTSACDVP